jgi:hypothetical protein
MAERIRFVNSVDAAEVRQETASLWAMFKQDPLSPVGWYMKNMIVPGAGLLLEGYVLCVSSFSLPCDCATDIECPVMCSSPLAISDRCCGMSFPSAGRHSRHATRRGSEQSTTWRFAASLSVSTAIPCGLSNRLTWHRSSLGRRPW